MNVFRHSLSLAVLFALISGAASAQTPVPPTLEQLEATYHKTLFKAQLPLLLKFQKDLHALLEKSPEADRDAIKFELFDIEKLIASSTPLDLALRKEPNDQESKPIKKRGVALALEPEDTKPPHAKDAALSLGKAVWPVSKLTAGTYELVGLGALPGKLPATPNIVISYHGVTGSVTLTASNQTKNDTTFRPIILGSFTLTEDVANEELTVSTADNKPWIIVKRLRLMKAAK
jgi:hypothetical protein